MAVELLPPNRPRPDPEFDGPTTGLPLIYTPGEDPERYLRLVANPFSGLVYLVALLWVLYLTTFEGFAGPLTPMVVLVLVAGVGLVPWLMEYHCLDCGASGRFTRWRKHTCRASWDRRQAGRRARFWGPSPPIQILLWIWILVALAFVANSVQL